MPADDNKKFDFGLHPNHTIFIAHDPNFFKMSCFNTYVPVDVDSTPLLNTDFKYTRFVYFIVFKKKNHSHFLYGFFKPSCSYEFIQLYEFSCFSIFFLDFAQVSFTGTSHDVFFQSLPMRGVNHVKFCTSLKKFTKKSQKATYKNSQKFHKKVKKSQKVKKVTKEKTQFTSRSNDRYKTSQGRI